MERTGFLNTFPPRVDLAEVTSAPAVARVVSAGMDCCVMGWVKGDCDDSVSSMTAAAVAVGATAVGAAFGGISTFFTEDAAAFLPFAPFTASFLAPLAATEVVAVAASLLRGRPRVFAGAATTATAGAATAAAPGSSPLELSTAFRNCNDALRPARGVPARGVAMPGSVAVVVTAVAVVTAASVVAAVSVVSVAVAVAVIVAAAAAVALVCLVFLAVDKFAAAFLPFAAAGVVGGCGVGGGWW